MNFIITAAALNPRSRTVHYSSTAGIFQGQTAHLASEANSSLLRGYLHATLDGLDKIENLIGKGTNIVIDVLIPDEVIAEKIRSASSSTFGRIKNFDNQDLWERLLARKKEFTLNVVSHPDEAADLDALWKWQKPGFAFGVTREAYSTAPDPRPSSL